MGQRCVTGQKSTAWNKVARILGLPRTSGDECVEFLDANALDVWFDLATAVQYGTRSEVVDDVIAQPFVYVDFMRLIGVMEADKETARVEYNKQYPLSYDASPEAWEERDAAFAAEYKFTWV